MIKSENQKLNEENANLHDHIQYLQKQQVEQKQNVHVQQLQHKNQQLQLHQQHKQFQQQIIQFHKNQHYSRSPKSTPTLPFDATQLAIDLEYPQAYNMLGKFFDRHRNAENRVKALEQELQNGEISRQRTALKAGLRAIYA